MAPRGTPTHPTLAEFLADDDPNAWWRLPCGVHENLLDEAVDALRAIATSERAEPTRAIAHAALYGSTGAHS